MVVLFLNFSEALKDAVHLIGARGVAHCVVEIFELMVEIADTAAPGYSLIEHGAALHLLHVLTEVANGETLRNGNLAFVGSFLVDNHAEERGLTRAVGTDQAYLLAWI